LTSSVVTGLLIPRHEMLEGGKAANRALAYLAHGGGLTVGADQHCCAAGLIEQVADPAKVIDARLSSRIGEFR